MRPSPPRAASLLLELLLPRGIQGDSIRGDLLEEFHTRAATRGAASARSRYWRDAVPLMCRYGLRRVAARNRASRQSRIIMDTLLQDARYAIRMMLKAPGFTVAVLLTLTLGIGASTGMFSVVNAILLRPLPYRAPDQLVYVSELANGERSSVAWPNFVDWRQRTRTIHDIAVYGSNASTMTGGDKPRRLNGRRVTWNFFRVLGVSPHLGRLFTEPDDHPAAAPTVVVSHALWQQRLGADRSIVGRSITLNERAHRVVGVLPPGFEFMRPDDVFVPIGLSLTKDSPMLDRGNHMSLYAVGRLAPGADAAAADREIQEIAAQLSREYPGTNASSNARVQPLWMRVVQDVRPTLVVLMIAVGLLLLIACVNVANLIAARAATRQHELAVRAALGGGRWRLVRQMLVETVLLSLAGGLLGVAAAYVFLDTLVAYAPEGIPRIADVQIDGTALMFAAASAAACALVFGALPAIQASGARGEQLMVRAARTRGGPAAYRTRRAFIVVEMALALVLLAGAGLMGRTIASLAAVKPGFDPNNVLAVRLMLTGERWRPFERRIAFYDQLVERVRALPGVSGAALTLSLPIEGSNWGSIFIVADKPVPARADLPASEFVPVSPEYFSTMRMRILRGRNFSANERPATEGAVAIVNETFAKRIWPGEDPIGKRLKQGWPEQKEPWREVVGIVNDVKLQGVDQETPMQVYLPIAHAPTASAALVLRTAVPPDTLVPQVESIVQNLDKDLPLFQVNTMEDLMRAAVARQKIMLVILGAFSVVALVLAVVGLYGVVAFSVTERTQEVGVRMALGARPGDILRLFVGHGFRTAAVGLAIGIAVAFVVSRWLEAVLFGVEPGDPATLAAVAALLLGCALLACAIPALRAARIDPQTALRTE